LELSLAKAIMKNEIANINEATKATFSERIERLEGISLFAPTIPKLNSNKTVLFSVKEAKLVFVLLEMVLKIRFCVFNINFVVTLNKRLKYGNRFICTSRLL
jgi:hypothetical protein